MSREVMLSPMDKKNLRLVETMIRAIKGLKKRGKCKNATSISCAIFGVARPGKQGKRGHTPHFCLRRFGALHVLASNASVATLAIFGRLTAAENACWGASPNPVFGTSWTC